MARRGGFGFFDLVGHHEENTPGFDAGPLAKEVAQEVKAMSGETFDAKKKEHDEGAPMREFASLIDRVFEEMNRLQEFADEIEEQYPDHDGVDRLANRIEEADMYITVRLNQMQAMFEAHAAGKAETDGPDQAGP
jgi:hypothetical protein